MKPPVIRAAALLLWSALAGCGSPQPPAGERVPLGAGAPADPGESFSLPDLAAQIYDCTQDGVLRDALPTAAADTAGIAVLVRRAFPGWHLATEREIACRFPLIGERPSDHWPRLGAGRAWWIWTGDFDGDGRKDRAMLLTSDQDAHEDLLGVLFASGQAAPVAPVGGWGVEVFEGEDADTLTIQYWEKSADIFAWENGIFRLVRSTD